jgi:hypothetical protein
MDSFTQFARLEPLLALLLVWVGSSESSRTRRSNRMICDQGRVGGEFQFMLADETYSRSWIPSNPPRRTGFIHSLRASGADSARFRVWCENSAEASLRDNRYISTQSQEVYGPGTRPKPDGARS